MQFISNYYSVLIPLAPFAAAVYSVLPHRGAGVKSYGFGVFAHIVAFAVAVVTLGQAATSGDVARQLVVCATPWSFLPTIELSIDRLSAVMMVVISGIGLVLYRYSVRYLQSELGQPRYQTLLALAISVLLVMVSSSDLVLLFLASLTGLVLLIFRATPAMGTLLVVHLGFVVGLFITMPYSFNLSSCVINSKTSVSMDFTSFRACSISRLLIAVRA